MTLFVDREDASDALSVLIEVVSAETMLAPTADFNFSEAIVAVGESVLLTDVSLGGVTVREWDLGDGTSATEEEVFKSWSRSSKSAETPQLFPASIQGEAT